MSSIDHALDRSNFCGNFSLVI